jgi:ABC-type proline/glycine betaine transport system ATPase subunit
MALGDRIAVLSSGATIEQLDVPSAIAGKPASAFVEDFIADFEAPVKS